MRAAPPAALVIFAHNVGSPAELRELVAALRGIASPAPLIAIDQEGGRVARIGAGVVALPPAMALAAAGDERRCERLGALLGRDLARLGISVDFAPVADLALSPSNTVIGTRSFGSDPDRTGRFAAAFARGLARGGVAAAVKHFPGHGSTADDSHLALPHSAVDAATLRARDLVPFVAALPEVPIVMSAHVVFDRLDASRPATLSPVLLTALLRHELGFDGVIATDALEMGAIAGETGIGSGAVQALAAGADLLVFGRDPQPVAAAVGALAEAVDDGRLDPARLADAARRVTALRERFATLAPTTDALDDAEPLAAARDAVTVVRGTPHLREGRPASVISFEGAAFDGAGDRRELPSLSAALRRRRWKSEQMRVPLAPDDDDLELLLAQLAALGDRDFVIVVRRAHLVPAQAAAVARILGVAPGAIVVSAREPFDALLWPAARHVVCTYGDDALMFEACADVLAGRAVPRGTLPVRVPDAARA